VGRRPTGRPGSADGSRTPAEAVEHLDTHLLGGFHLVVARLQPEQLPGGERGLREVGEDAVDAEVEELQVPAGAGVDDGSRRRAASRTDRPSPPR